MYHLEYLYDYYWAMYGQAELKRSEGKAKEDKQAVGVDSSEPVGSGLTAVGSQ